MRNSEFLEEYYEKKKKEAQLPQQETLYTEEQAKEPIKEMIKFIDDINDNDRSEFNYYYDYIMDKLKELLESKKD